MPGRGPVKLPITPDEENYIRANYMDTTVKEMANKLQRGLSTVYGFMDDNYLEVFRLQPGRRRTVQNPELWKPVEVY